MKLLSNYDRALIDALIMMDEFPDLEPTSALKQCASDYGIQYGAEMGDFISWAMEAI
jgi:hypothetical protein